MASLEENYQKMKKKNKYLRRKEKKQRDLIEEMIEFLNKRNIQHNFKVPEHGDEDEELDDEIIFTRDANNNIKQITKKSLKTFLPQHEIDKKLKKLINQ